MIIDIHAHILGDRGWLPSWFWDGIKERMAARTGRSPQQIEDEVLAGVWDPNGDKAIADMDAAGVDKLMVLCIDWGLAEYMGEAGYSIEQLNQMHYELIQKHPDRLLFGVGVDPRRPNAVKIAEQGMKEYDAKVLKLYPPAGFYPSDRIAYPLYEKCVEYGIPVEFHSGPFAWPLKSKYGHPLYYDEVAADFPEMKIICSHAGHGWWRDMLAVARSKENIYLDLSGWGAQTVFPKRLYESVREMLDMVPGRVMFASDYLGFRNMLAPWVKAWTALPDSLKDWGIAFSEQEIKAFLGGTAAKLLGTA